MDKDVRNYLIAVCVVVCLMIAGATIDEYFKYKKEQVELEIKKLELEQWKK